MNHLEFQSIPGQVPHVYGYYTTLQTHLIFLSVSFTINSEAEAEELLSLAVHPELKRQELDKIVGVVNGVFQHPCK